MALEASNETPELERDELNMENEDRSFHVGETDADDDEAEMIVKALEASKETYDRERDELNKENEDFEAACLASMHTYQKEVERRGTKRGYNCSRWNDGYDSDLGF
ncbi:hypothetical protein ACFE04_026789 [Oxalis oulophora]